jgi:serine/threonine-protein kinase
MARIGRYEIESEIGRGAMGIVYLAQDPRLRRPVAVKTYSLPEGLGAEQVREYQHRFLREAQAAAGLSHPGIVTIYDADEDPDLGLPFIAMEYVPGPSLRQLLEKGGRLDPRWVFRMAGTLADALQVAHQAGIIHRDIKPANILLRAPDGRAKIADFGVARLSASELTRSGASLGSPAYMSPEQFRGGNLDGRSDLFSLAVILYEVLCGQRPFTGDDLPALAYAIAHEQAVPITRRVRGLPPALEEFFDRALAKDPADRFADGDSFRRAFEGAWREEAAASAEATRLPAEPDGEATAIDPAGEPEDAAPADAPPARRWRGRLLEVKFAAAAILFIAVAAVSGYFWLIRPAHLRLDARSSLASGRLSLLVDGEEVYSRDLAAPAGGNLLTRVLRRDQETFQSWIRVPPGRHELAAQVTALGEAPGQRNSIVVDLRAGETRTLRMVAGRTFGSPVSLRMD